MKKLFALITTVALLLALCVVPFGLASADEPEQNTGTVVVDLDFSETTDGDLFGSDYGGWEVSEGTLKPKLAWANAYLDQEITGFGVKKTVITLDVFVKSTEPTLGLCVGILDDVSVVGENSDPSGITLRIYKGYETLYTSFAGAGGVNRIMDSQGGIFSDEPVLHTLEMTFNADKTVTVKCDGEVLSHSTDGNSMENVNYGELHDFSSGYIALKGTSVNTYIDNLKVVQYDETTPEDPPVNPDDPEDPPVTPEEPPILDLSEELGEIINIDFSDAADALRFGNGWAGGWEIKEDGHFHTSTAWESAYLKQPIETFGTRRVVITVEFYIAEGNLMPVFTFGVVDDPSCIANDNFGSSGISVRVFGQYETIYTAYTGSQETRIMDTQVGLYSAEPVPHTLEMTFDMDKTVTIKVDGTVMAHSDGTKAQKINYGSLHDFSTGYLAMKATSTDTYISSIIVEQFDTPGEPIQEEPTNPEIPEGNDISQEPDPNGNGNNGAGTDITENGAGDTITIEIENNIKDDENTKKSSGGCGSSISGFSVIAFVIAAGLTLIIVKRRHSKK